MDQLKTGYRIRGRVQGVGFRYWTARMAQQLGVRGIVRNRADGSVEVFAAGPPDAMKEFERRLRRGPLGAEVVDVQRIEVSEPLPDGFEIRR